MPRNLYNYSDVPNLGTIRPPHIGLLWFVGLLVPILGTSEKLQFSGFFFNDDVLVKSPDKAPRWLSKKFDIQGVVFSTGLRQYMWYAEGLLKIYNAVDRSFCDAIKLP
jgi:hypothetical protein